MQEEQKLYKGYQTPFLKAILKIYIYQYQIYAHINHK